MFTRLAPKSTRPIIFLVVAPLLTFTGVEGKMFSPMVITVMLALAGAFILSLTFVPAMVALLIRGEVTEKDVKAIALGKGAFALAGLVFLMLGREFIPTLDEGDIGGQVLSIP
jgi:heavy metal efflux system protein